MRVAWDVVPAAVAGFEYTGTAEFATDTVTGFDIARDEEAARGAGDCAPAERGVAVMSVTTAAAAWDAGAASLDDADTEGAGVGEPAPLI